MSEKKEAFDSLEKALHLMNNLFRRTEDIIKKNYSQLAADGNERMTPYGIIGGNSFFISKSKASKVKLHLFDLECKLPDNIYSAGIDVKEYILNAVAREALTDVSKYGNRLVLATGLGGSSADSLEIAIVRMLTDPKYLI